MADGLTLRAQNKRGALAISPTIVFFELWAIVWIQNKYMEAPFLRATLQVVVGGGLVLAAGILIGTG